jgi:hypothetical protein
LNRHFDVIGFCFKAGLNFSGFSRRVKGGLASAVRASQYSCRLVPMTLVRFHAADEHIVLQDYRCGHIAYSPADDTPRRGPSQPFLLCVRVGRHPAH